MSISIRGGNVKIGIFGILRNGAKAVVDGAKKLGGAVIDGGKRLKDKVVEFKEDVKNNGFREAVSNVWSGFTGQKEYDEAKKKLEELEMRYNKEKNAFDMDIKIYSTKIMSRVEAINAAKAKIKWQLFPRFAELLAKLKDVKIDDSFTWEKYMHEELHVDKLKTKEELMTIDFDKNYWSNTFKAIFTVGFYTRKKAHESMLAVQEEEKVAEENIAKMNTERKRIQLIEKSMDSIEHYFTNLIEIYRNMLMRLDNAVNTLYV